MLTSSMPAGNLPYKCLSARPLKVYWYDKVNNYGDLLTPEILSGLGFSFEQGTKYEHDAIMTGSIAKFARPGAIVLGSGFIRHNDPVPAKAKWEWVRGPLTRAKVRQHRYKCGLVYGDPAWLLPKIWPAPPKRFKTLFVPHYVDYEQAKRVYRRLPLANLLTQDVYATTMKIASAEQVISSSLHGLIVAQAYGIPAAWVQISNKLHGDGFKFHDHYASMGLEAIKSTVKRPVFQLGTVQTEPMMEVLDRCFR